MDEQIKVFLESREWLRKKLNSFETPGGDTNNFITVTKEFHNSFRDVKARVQIGENSSPNDTPIYEVAIFFEYFRHQEGFGPVFVGFISSIDDLISAFKLLGVDEKYLKQ
jgi:hypothetical protein